MFDFLYAPLVPAALETVVRSEKIFIAHSRAYDFLGHASAFEPSQLLKKRVWVSGTQSWFKLAAQGVWIEGSLDGQGFESIETFTTKKLLRFTHEKWALITHQESTATPQSTLVPTYRHQLKLIPSEIENATHLYWSSGLPFQTVWNHLNSNEQENFKKKTHACGVGKTAALLRAHGIEPILGEMSHG